MAQSRLDVHLGLQALPIGAPRVVRGCVLRVCWAGERALHPLGPGAGGRAQNGQHSRIWPTTPFLWSLSLSCQTPKVTVEPTFSPNFTSLHILFPLPGVFAPPFSTLRTPIHELRKLSLSPSPPINGKRWVSFLCASVASSFLSLHCFHSTVTAYTDLAPL